MSAAYTDSSPTSSLPPTLSNDDFSARLHTFHRAVYAAEPFAFDAVMRRFYAPELGWVAQDHCFVDDGTNLHLFVLSGPLADAQVLIDAVRARDWELARRHKYCVGETHLVGRSFEDLKPVGRILDEPNGEFAILCQGVSGIRRVGDRWLDVFTASGPNGHSLCLAWSDDLSHWTFDPRNPVWRAPAWAGGTHVCKSAYLVPYADRWLIYYNLNLAEGTTTVSLISTTDFQTFEDHGPVVKFPHQFRGTQGCESPCILLRNGLWHLFCGTGDGWWHAVSHRPDRFLSAQGISSATVQGVYWMGPFHAAKVIEHRGRWWMTSTYKEEHRRKCRAAGKPIFRGTDDDEAGLLEGLFYCQVEWEGDRPVLVSPSSTSGRPT